MGLDPSYVGFTYPPTPPYRVSREKIREFANAIGATEAIYLDPAAAGKLGYPDVITPPTFPIVLAAPCIDALVADERLGLDFTRVVHGDQRFIYHRPVHAGDVVECYCTVTDIAERAGAGFLTTTTEIRTVEGELVVTAISRLVVRADGGTSA